MTTMIICVLGLLFLAWLLWAASVKGEPETDAIVVVTDGTVVTALPLYFVPVGPIARDEE
jgi:hypothetical protein